MENYIEKGFSNNDKLVDDKDSPDINKDKTLEVLIGYKERPEYQEVITNTLEILKRQGFNIDSYAELQAYSAEIANEYIFNIKDKNSEKQIDEDEIFVLFRLEMMHQVDSVIGKFNKLKKLIEESPDDIITQSWIQKRDVTCYRHLRKFYTNIAGAVDWKFIARKFDIEERSKFRKYNFWNNPESLALRIKEFEKLVEAEEAKNPDGFQFNTKLFARLDGGLFEATRKVFRDPKTGLPNWDLLISQMSPKWQRIWEEERPKNLDYHLNSIRDVLEAKKPPRFNPTWIAQNVSRAAYSYMNEYYSRRSQGEYGVDWEAFLDDLGGDWKRSFKVSSPTKLEDLVPEKQYEDESSISEFVEKYGDQYYLCSIFIDSSEQKDRALQNEMLSALAGMAKDGNISAENKLLSHLRDIAMEWSTFGQEEFRNRIQFIPPKEMNDIFRKYIYQYDRYRDQFSLPGLILGGLRHRLMYGRDTPKGEIRLDAGIDNTDSGSRTFGESIGFTD